MSHENILSLDQIYDNNELFCFVNAAGDMFIPDENGKQKDIERPDDLPMKICNLRDNYWTEWPSCFMRVESYKGHPGMTLSFVYGKLYLEELMHREPAIDELERLYDAVEDTASIIERDHISPFYPDCNVFLGHDTDPSGSEITVFVPYHQRSKLDEIIDDLSGIVDAYVKELF